MSENLTCQKIYFSKKSFTYKTALRNFNKKHYFPPPNLKETGFSDTIFTISHVRVIAFHVYASQSKSKCEIEHWYYLDLRNLMI